MHIEETKVIISTPEGQMSAFLYAEQEYEPKPAVILLMEAFGLTPHIQEVAVRIAKEGYVVVTPDLYYRESPNPGVNTTFDYDEVEQAMATMYRMDFGKPVEADLEAAIAYIKSIPQVLSHKVGMTGFCLGGGLTFLAACKFSSELAAAAPFYGMVLDDWVEQIANITVPIYLFHGGIDPFIPQERVQQIESRFQQLGKEYSLQVYPDADHGFFCHERSSYHPAAAKDAWHKLTHFLHQHLQA